MAELDIAATRDPQLARAFCDLLLHTLLANPHYITSQEIRFGLSDDERNWSASLSARLANGMVEGLEKRSDDALIVARDAKGELVGGMYVSVSQSDDRRVCTIEDVAVLPDRRRAGIAKRLFEAAEAHATAKKAHWMFAEVGAHNTAGQALATAGGFQVISKIFGKPVAESGT